MAIKKLLVIPHIGTAYGHLIRVGELLTARYLDVPEVFMIVPESALPMAKAHIPSRVKLLTYKLRPTVTNPDGVLDEKGFLALLQIDREFCDRLRPDLILCDPGIRGGLLAEERGIRWEALMHGCYLPLPPLLKAKSLSPSTVELAELAWGLVQRALDHLVRTGSDNDIKSWSELRMRGRILIPNSACAEPAEIGVHLSEPLPRVGFSAGSVRRCVLTLCSSGDIQVSEEVLRKLVLRFGEVAVVGPASELPIENVHYLGRKFAIETVVGKNTVVISHGGHGTLRAVRHASRVIVIPGDIDQLCNALVAHVNWGAELAIGPGWFDRIKSNRPFRRLIEWQDLLAKLDKEILREGDQVLCE